MVMSAKGLRPEKDCAGEDQQNKKKYRSVLSSERAPQKNKTVTVKSNKYLVMSPRWGSTPRLTG
jgi:hypothetical protein